MIRLFDATFLTGTMLVVVAVILALAAVTRDDLPLVGTGVGALLAVALVGMAACAVGGISQAPTLGWTAPGVVIGVVLGMAALLIVAAGVFGWSAVLRPIAPFVPGQVGSATDLQAAIFALGVVIGIKWLTALGMAVAAR